LTKNNDTQDSVTHPNVVVEFLAFFYFSLNKSCKTNLGPVLPIGGRNWQLVYPHWQQHLKGQQMTHGLLTELEGSVQLTLVLG
jgi:hypothetical protein